MSTKCHFCRTYYDPKPIVSAVNRFCFQNPANYLLVYHDWNVRFSYKNSSPKKHTHLHFKAFVFPFQVQQSNYRTNKILKHETRVKSVWNSLTFVIVTRICLSKSDRAIYPIIVSQVSKKSTYRQLTIVKQPGPGKHVNCERYASDGDQKNIDR